jgi:formylglycine-generating enzyme required for sulfatase activity
MSNAGKNTDRVSTKTSRTASMFEKALQGFAIGDLPYADVQSHLTRWLTTGTSAEELQEVLRRHEMIEPLPEHARADLRRMLAEHAVQPTEPRAPDAPPPADAPVVAAKGLPLDPALRAVALDVEAINTQDDLGPTHSKIRELRKGSVDAPAPAPTPAADATARLHAEQAQRDARQRDEDLAAARAQLAARDTAIGQLQQALAERETESAALQDERDATQTILHAERAHAEELAADLADLRETLTAEQQRNRELERAHNERLAAAAPTNVRGKDAARATQRLQAEIKELREALDSRAATLEHVRKSLVERVDELSVLQRENADAAGARDALTQTVARLQGELAAAHSAHQSVQSAGAQRLSAQSSAELQALRDALEASERNLSDSQQMLAERNSQLATAHREHRDAVAELEARAEAGTKRLREAVVRNESMASELKASEDLAAAIGAQKSLIESQARADRSQVAGLQKQLQASENLVEQLQLAAQAGAARPMRALAAPTPTPLQPMQAQPVESLTVSEFVVQEVKPAGALHESAPFGRAGRWSVARSGAILGVVAVLAVGAWALTRHRDSVTSAGPAPVVAVAGKPPVAAPANTPGSVIRDCSTCPALTVLPLGRFKQGSSRTETAAARTEQPQHWVTINQSLAMTTNAVTVENFAAFVDATHHDMKACDTYDGQWRHRTEADWKHPGFAQTNTHPVTCVSWNDAKAYAAWLSEKTGHRYRLPSASEWEFAARAVRIPGLRGLAAGTGACAYGNVADQSLTRRFRDLPGFPCSDGYVFTAPVGSFKVSAFGLDDMLGNVFEWTEDCWHPDYQGAPVDGSARSGGDCSEHELRGGSWSSNPGFVRFSARNHFAANYRASSFGIRLVREISP